MRLELRGLMVRREEESLSLPNSSKKCQNTSWSSLLSLLESTAAGPMSKMGWSKSESGSWSPWKLVSLGQLKLVFLTVSPELLLEMRVMERSGLRARLLPSRCSSEESYWKWMEDLRLLGVPCLPGLPCLDYRIDYAGCD